jgi:hypothetical protein
MKNSWQAILNKPLQINDKSFLAISLALFVFAAIFKDNDSTLYI